MAMLELYLLLHEEPNVMVSGCREIGQLLLFFLLLMLSSYGVCCRTVRHFLFRGNHRCLRPAIRFDLTNFHCLVRDRPETSTKLDSNECVGIENKRKVTVGSVIFV